MQKRSDLDQLWGEQILWMITSVQAYDSGQTSEYKRMALIIRTLLHDTASSTSLLTQIDGADSMRWLSMAPAMTEMTPTGHCGLWVSIPSEPGFRHVSGEPKYSMDFDKWWRYPVLRTHDFEFSRSDLVLRSVNVDGGAHVDPALPEPYANLTRRGGLNPLRVNSEGDTYTDSSNPVPSAIRTIASELWCSFRSAGLA